MPPNPTETPKPPSRAGSSGRTPSKSAIHEGRFPPGTVLAERYRIVALLGSGGMGEVYRADDLTLGQAVALKFLPAEIATHEQAIARLRNEVRIARQVSHPNVCRVYDVGTADDSTFISMEYVDGEDLESLLRRIGRLPADKGIQIARKVCAGLAAAHEKGILHRDLKPSNVMLDGRGEAVITDFGLAALAEEIQGGDVRSGTPAYMAPEQLAGKEVTARSDIYTLGLMFYEIFTGRRPYDEKTLPGLVRAQKLATPANPTTLVSDLDPAVERVIMRCLAPDSMKRPPSALAVAAALPGGDPLAAALAAGETPSPQLVAAAGLTTGLSPRVGISCLAAIVIALLGASYLSIRTSALEAMRLQNSPEVLESKARDILQRLGYTAAAADSGQGFVFQSHFLDYVQKNEKPRPDWDRILAGRPSPLRYWYRESPQPMIPVEFHDDALTPALIQRDDPPTTFSGMVNLELDAEGRLVRFQAIPPQFEETTKPAPAADWKPLFSAAGLDASQFQPADPQWLSLAAFDSRAAWKGTWPGTHYPLHVEAAAWRGKPVFFSLIGPWNVPDRMPPEHKQTLQRASAILLLVLALSILIGAVLLARFNLERGRGDRAGALRLAFAIFCVQMLLWICRAHFAPSLGNFLVFLLAISTSLFAAGVLFILYLALEPYVRRHWPQTIISWSRLLTGRLQDPLVASDVVFGLILAMIWILLIQGHDLIMRALGS
ncbi:MAG: serine/threonine-protein kinase, partial [Bryobacteraceae bacterium]